MSSIFGSFIVFWMFVLAFIMMIGGFFMFRKFLKSMPKQDGKSELDWQDHYIDQTRAFWSDEGLQLLNELVQPVPELFRDVARRTIAAKIGKLALEENAEMIDQNLIIKGYIMATPARDHRFLVKTLKEKQIDFSPYREHLKIRV